MKPRSSREQKIFLACIEQPEETRMEFLTSICQGDLSLVNRIHELLRVHEKFSDKESFHLLKPDTKGTTYD